MSSFCLTACNHFAIIAAMLHIWRVNQLAHGTAYFRGESRQLWGRGTIGAREIT